MKPVKIALTTYYLPTKTIDKNRTRGVKGQNMLMTALDYCDFVYNSKAIPIIVGPMGKDDSWINEIVNFTDALILSGGEDNDSSLYAKTPSPFLGEVVIERDNFEIKLIDAFIKAKKPILGICRGMQLLNIYFNGSLYQDYRELDEKLEYHCENPYQKIIHKVKLKKEFEEIYNQKELSVNSHHHQFIKKLGDNLKVTATSNDGVIEGIISTKYDIVAVQWHPEMIYKNFSIQTKLMDYFIDLIKK